MLKLNFSRFLLLTTTLSLSIFNNSIVSAQSTQFKPQSRTLISLEFPDSPNKKPPTSTAGAAMRAPKACFRADNDKDFKALIPYQSIQTASSQPTFFVYIPKTSAQALEFSLNDEKGNTIDSQEISLAENTPGIIKIDFSPNQELKNGQLYTWKINLNCGRYNPNGIIREEGNITKSELSQMTESELSETADILAKAEIYANQSVWLDTLSYAISLKESNPNKWNQLLQSVGLEKYSNEPFLFDVKEYNESLSQN